MYLTAPILRCAFKPSVNVSGALPSSFSRASVASSFLRSDLVPISISGVAGQWYWSSGYHCVFKRKRGEGRRRRRRKVGMRDIEGEESVSTWVLATTVVLS